jgi:hypothetical protein
MERIIGMEKRIASTFCCIAAKIREFFQISSRVPCLRAFLSASSPAGQAVGRFAAAQPVNGFARAGRWQNVPICVLPNHWRL